MRILVVGDPHGNVIKKVPRGIDLIIITGDLGNADLARKLFFKNVERKRKGLEEIEEDAIFIKKVHKEIYDSTMKVIKKLSKIAPTYSIIGNVGTATDYEMKKEEEKWGIKLPKLRKGIKGVKDFNLVRNSVRNINELKVGFLEYFIDDCWVKEFDPKNKKRMKKAIKETAKARKILKWFVKNKIDILVSHQPPYGILDKVTWNQAPKHWKGKHAGSKVILDYIKKKQPRYVFCGHIHERKGWKKIGKTEVINAGISGDYFVVDIK